MTLEKEKRFLLLLSSKLCGYGASKADVLDYIDSSKWIVLSENEKMYKHNRKELVWRNDLAFVCKHLAQEGYFVDGVRNNWSITDKGRKYLNILLSEVLETRNFSKLSSKLLEELKNNKIIL